MPKKPVDLKPIQPPTSENDIRRPVSEEATKDEVRQATSSCVNHLCGCS